MSWGDARRDRRPAGAVGYESVNGKARGLIRHWNGKSWTKVKSPVTADGVYLNSVSASSGKNVWISGVLVQGGKSKQVWLRWNGRSWKSVVAAMPKDSDTRSPDVLALGDKDVWSFARKGWGPFYPDVRHFNGRNWSTVKAPATISDASAVDGKQIWTTGWIHGGRSPVPTVMRWDGKSWKKIVAPKGAGELENLTYDGAGGVRNRGDVILKYGK